MKKIMNSTLLIYLLIVCLFIFAQGIPQVSAATTPTVYICGDSTVMTYSESYAPQAGWGQFISQYFTADVSFVNKAIGGRSSKSFIVEGRLDEIIEVIQPNDYLFVQFGHNDATVSKPERYTDPDTTYKEYLRQYIDEARSKDAIPVLITPVARLNYSDGTFQNDFPAYCTAMKEVAEEKDVACIDLMSKSLSYYASIGYDNVYPYYMVSVNGTDYTHFTEEGATQIARIVAECVRELDLSISQYVINSNQAEYAAYGSDAVFENKNDGYNGTGYINFPSDGGYLEFQNVGGDVGGTATLKIRNALGASDSRTGRIQVNGGTWQDITFDSTGSWTTWSEKEVSVTLNSGTDNTIRLESTGEDLANIDQLDITISGSTATPTPTPTPMSGDETNLAVNYTSSDWGTGATINITIKNNSTEDIDGWTLAFTFSGDQQINNIWGASYTQNGTSVSVVDEEYNAVIAANGGTVSFGFNISYSGTNYVPSSFTLNGEDCSIY